MLGRKAVAHGEHLCVEFPGEILARASAGPNAKSAVNASMEIHDCRPARLVGLVSKFSDRDGPALDLNGPVLSSNAPERWFFEGFHLFLPNLPQFRDGLGLVEAKNPLLDGGDSYELTGGIEDPTTRCGHLRPPGHSNQPTAWKGNDEAGQQAGQGADH